MTHPNKVKGNIAERAVVTYLRDRGFIHAERSRSGWTDDRGDIDGLPGVCIEVKNEKRINLAGYMAELERETLAAHADTGVCVVKRRGTSDVAEWYAVMPMSMWVTLMKENER